MNEQELSALYAQIKDFLHNPNSGIVSQETARAFAIEMTQRHEALTARLLTHQEEITEPNGAIFYTEYPDTQTTKRSVALFRDEIPTLPFPAIRFHHYSGIPLPGGLNPLVHLPQRLEIATLNQLQIDAHTDDATQQEVERLLADRKIRSCDVQTLYLGDHYGNQGVVAGIPRFIRDTRPELGGIDLHLKHVEVPLTNRQIRLVRTVTTILEEYV